MTQATRAQRPVLWLQVLEACMKNCGRRFHNEVGKFRFLNELIKVVSPKVSRGSVLIRELLCVPPPPILLAGCRELPTSGP